MGRGDRASHGVHAARVRGAEALAATADSALLAATWTAFAVQAAKVDRAAAALAAPEALWGAFATVLSAATARRDV